jgi:hypothetical protein
MSSNYYIFIVGTNPLPNYVVGKYFLQKKQVEGSVNNCTFFLIYSQKTQYSEGTCLYAENLKRVFENEFLLNNIWLIGLEDPENPHCIECTVTNEITERIKKDFGSVHLNYTGGTKVMAVHIYRTLKEKIPCDLSFSYLSGKDFTLKNDFGDSVLDLRKKVSIEFDTLLSIHGYTVKKDPKKEEYTNTDGYLAKMIKNGTISDFLTWEKEFISKYLKNTKRGKVDEQECGKFDAHEKNLETYPWLTDFIKVLSEDKIIVIPEKDKWFTHDTGKQSIINYLDGTWFERYVQVCLLPLAESSNNTIQVHCNKEIKKIPPQEKNFEVDAILINGYQVIVVSVTTDRTAGLSKNKGFEVIHRALEIGGEESKAILITGMDGNQSIKDLESDLNQVSNIGCDKLLVLGTPDWGKETLLSKIKDFILR